MCTYLCAMASVAMACHDRSLHPVHLIICAKASSKSEGVAYKLLMALCLALSMYAWSAHGHVMAISKIQLLHAAVHFRAKDSSIKPTWAYHV